MSPLLSYHDARSLLLDNVPRPQSEERAMQDCLHQVAASDYTADSDVPPFRKSFMDGYALRSGDVIDAPVGLRCVAEVLAGSQLQPAIGPGECVAIMTGAPVPSDADAVQMVEKTRRDQDTVTVLEPVSVGSHLAEKGSEVQSGEVVIKAGRYLGPAEIGVLASFGHSVVRVWRAPTVAIVPTGDELVEVSDQPGPAQIRNSSACMLKAQCQQLGLQTRLISPAADTAADTLRAFDEARSADLILFTGGVSMGERDYVHRVLGAAGVDLVFHKAAIKPGKPLLAGRDGPRLVLGLPGNPVSTFVTFEMFVRPAVQRWMGLDGVGLRTVSARLSETVTQRPGRLFFMPARTRLRNLELAAEPVSTRGSADLTAFAGADSLLIFPADRAELQAGERVELILLEGRQP